MLLSCCRCWQHWRRETTVSLHWLTLFRRRWTTFGWESVVAAPVECHLCHCHCLTTSVDDSLECRCQKLPQSVTNTNLRLGVAVITQWCVSTQSCSSAQEECLFPTQPAEIWNSSTDSFKNISSKCRHVLNGSGSEMLLVVLTTHCYPPNQTQITKKHTHNSSNCHFPTLAWLRVDVLPKT